MKDFNYYGATKILNSEIRDLEEEEWTWKIPEGKTEITREDLREIQRDYTNYYVKKDRKLAHLKDDLKEARLEEFYQDVCKDEKINPDDPRVRRLFLQARGDNPFSIALMYERFKSDIDLFIKYEVVQNGGEDSE